MKIFLLDDSDIVHSDEMNMGKRHNALENLERRYGDNFGVSRQHSIFFFTTMGLVKNVMNFDSKTHDFLQNSSIFIPKTSTIFKHHDWNDCAKNRNI